MYVPAHFAETDQARLHATIGRAALGTLVVQTADGLDANHLPFVLDREVGACGRLRAHVPRANPLSTQLTPDHACLVIFHGADGYVSPSWYATKARHGKVVPTWNYAVVHAHGHARLVDDAAWVRDQVEALTAAQENGRASPWAVSDAPRDFVARLIASLVGIEIRIERLVGKTKASQNQPDENRASLLAALDAEAVAPAFRALMRAALDPSQ